MYDEVLHSELARLNRLRLVPAAPAERLEDARAALDDMHALQRLELDFLTRELVAIRPFVCDVPRTGAAFVAWFEQLRLIGPGQGDPLFPWLAEHASLDELRWFLRQEISGEAGFEDLVALCQLRMPEQAKLELARNYWDELGRGSARGMHGPMLHRLAVELRIADDREPVTWEPLALANAMVGFATNRAFAYHAIGALGVIELTAPDRAALVNVGLRRCGVSAHARQYFALHASLDIKHSEAWNREILQPLVDAQPEVAPWIAEGALARLEAGRRCFVRYRCELGLDRRAEPRDASQAA